MVWYSVSPRWRQRSLPAVSDGGRSLQAVDVLTRGPLCSGSVILQGEISGDFRSGKGLSEGHE